MATATSSVLSLFKTSIGKKQVMGLTGLALCGFLVSHLIGNLLMFVGSDIFNAYGHALITNPLIIPAEIGLAIVFLSHIGLAVKLTLENKAARPQAYAMKKSTGHGETFASKTMHITGLIILIFLGLHLFAFKFSSGGEHFMTTLNGEEVRDLHRTVIDYFQNPLCVAWYVFAMAAMGVHLSHGFQSAFQSLGINHPRYTPCIKKCGCAFSIIIPLGYASLAVWGYLQ